MSPPTGTVTFLFKDIEGSMRASRIGAMARLVAPLVLALLSLLYGHMAQSATSVFVANPGGSFGPLEIGGLPPPIWDVSCRHPLLGTRFYSSRLGMFFVIFVAPDIPGPGIPEGRISILSVKAEPDIDPSIYTRGCVTFAGRAVTTRISYRLPETRYVSSKGVEFGASVQAVLAAHGTPWRMNKVMNTDRVTAIDYCGIVFYFDDSGRVNEIAVLNPRLCAFR